MLKCCAPTTAGAGPAQHAVENAEQHKGDSRIVSGAPLGEVKKAGEEKADCGEHEQRPLGEVDQHRDNDQEGELGPWESLHDTCPCRRARTSITERAVHLPPRADGSPRPFSALAVALALSSANSDNTSLSC
jgi:hypothetical protein